MISYALTSATGWLMLILLVAIVAYPFLLRAGLLGPSQPFLKRMRFHYWLGYIFAGTLGVHLLTSMSPALMAAVNSASLYAATAALVLVAVQIWLGSQLTSPRLALRRLMRRWHFWTMLALVGFILVHVALASPLFQLFFGGA